MTGYVFCHSACFSCGKPFAYNPNKVPSIRINGAREPICQTCVDIANPIRIKNGLSVIVPHPDAYEPMPEAELDNNVPDSPAPAPAPRPDAERDL